VRLGTVGIILSGNHVGRYDPEREERVNGYLVIDGSRGEGGGQILRTGLALSLLLHRPVLFERIRDGRHRPGLRRQHLTAVQAAARIGRAKVSGAHLGSQSLSFSPTTIEPGTHHFRIGTAGSTTLVLQTLLPPLMLAEAPTELTLEGGTHNPGAPTFDFVHLAYLPLLNRLGPQITARIERYGFYPQGGGRIDIHIRPAPVLSGLQLLERGPLEQRRVEAVVSHLPINIAQRELAEFMHELPWPLDTALVHEVQNAGGPGNVLTAIMQFQQVTEVCTCLGRRGLPAERVAQMLAQEVRDYLANSAPVGSYLADQLLLPLSLAAAYAGRESNFVTGLLSSHSTTHIDLLQLLLPIKIDVVDERAVRRVKISPAGEP
jgi:RNA 3'-terminal phosphate cyclase (ATP)